MSALKVLKEFEGCECNPYAIKKGVSVFESDKVGYQPYDEGIINFIAKAPDENSTVHLKMNMEK